MIDFVNSSCLTLVSVGTSTIIPVPVSGNLNNECKHDMILFNSLLDNPLSDNIDTNLSVNCFIYLLR